MSLSSKTNDISADLPNSFGHRHQKLKKSKYADDDPITQAAHDLKLLSQAIAEATGTRTEETGVDLISVLTDVGQTVFEWDIEKDRITWAENASSVFGLRDKAAISTSSAYHQLIEPEHLQRRKNEFCSPPSQLSATGNAYHIYYRMRPHGPRTSQVIWLEERGIWWPDKDGKPTIARGIVRIVSASHIEEVEQNYYRDRDELTGLLNRIRLVEALEASMGRAERKRGSCAFLIAAISNLNDINESFGFDVGDEAITTAGRLIRKHLRGGDTIGRYSSNKFGIVLNDCTQEDMHIATGRIIKAVHSSKFKTSKCKLAATLSVGGIILPDQATMSGEAISYALQALERAREKCPNSFVAFEPSPDSKTSRERNISIADEIVSALDNNRLRIVLQPMMSAETGEAIYHESLLRMFGQGGKCLTAGQFIPVAEQLGLVAHVDLVSLKLSVALLKQHSDLRLSVNVSSLTTNDSEWSDALKDLILGSPDVANRLIIEITETAAISDMDQTIEFVEMLKGLGCKVAIDDFGAGYTSFRNLRNLNVDMVKIDGSFVENISDNEEDRAFIKTLVELAETLGAQTVAEWVKDQESAEILNDVGVTYLQGFHYGQPFFAEEYSHKKQDD